MGRRRVESQPDMWSLRCEQCNRYLIMTESGYWSCPLGHGRLIVDSYEAAQDQPAGSFLMFPDDLPLESEL